LYFFVPCTPHYLESYGVLGFTGPFKRHIVHLSTLLNWRALSAITRRNQNISETALSHYLPASASKYIRTFWTKQLVETTRLSDECPAMIEGVLRYFHMVSQEATLPQEQTLVPS
jgi:hypothetical protein